MISKDWGIWIMLHKKYKENVLQQWYYWVQYLSYTIVNNKLHFWKSHVFKRSKWLHIFTSNLKKEKVDKKSKMCIQGIIKYAIIKNMKCDFYRSYRNVNKWKRSNFSFTTELSRNKIKWKQYYNSSNRIFRKITTNIKQFS